MLFKVSSTRQSFVTAPFSRLKPAPMAAGAVTNTSVTFCSAFVTAEFQLVTKPSKNTQKWLF